MFGLTWRKDIQLGYWQKKKLNTEQIWLDLDLPQLHRKPNTTRRITGLFLPSGTWDFLTLPELKIFIYLLSPSTLFFIWALKFETILKLDKTYLVSSCLKKRGARYRNYFVINFHVKASVMENTVRHNWECRVVASLTNIWLHSPSSFRKKSFIQRLNLLFIDIIQTCDAILFLECFHLIFLIYSCLWRFYRIFDCL